MRENKKDGSLILIILVSGVIFLLVVIAAFLRSRNPEEFNGLQPTIPAKSTSTPASEPSSDPTSVPAEDTTAPAVTTKRVAVSYGSSVLPEAFIEQIEDESECVVTYATGETVLLPDFGRYGLQEVSLTVTDSAGNTTTVTEMLNIINLKERMELQLGTPIPEAEAFLMVEGSEISFITNIDLIDISVTGEYGVEFLVDGDVAMTILSIVE